MLCTYETFYDIRGYDNLRILEILLGIIMKAIQQDSKLCEVSSNLTVCSSVAYTDADIPFPQKLWLTSVCRAPLVCAGALLGGELKSNNLQYNTVGR